MMCKDLVKFIQDNGLEEEGFYVCLSNGISCCAVDVITVGIEAGDGQIGDMVIDIGNVESIVHNLTT